ncbi:Holliday junction branch migration protein RuvA [Moraxella oblonga]|uniref:Holliday junction branch migration protein RuvA n=1 Tax=Moraxella oblonga TaxID=200413 RepID=UPI000831524A|nr:Holliday junction branch migration protein RuvA [Moraxella oblonga]
MIALLQGEICHLSAPTAYIMTTGGVGYEVELSLTDFCELKLGETVKLWTHLVVREDAQILCGFLHKDDKDVFKTLIKISGVGLKMALAILSTLSRTELYNAVEYGDETALTRVAGVGKKTAQRLIIELKGKLNSMDKDLLATPDNAQNTAYPTQNPMYIMHETESALMSLGYKEKEAQSAIKTAKQQFSDDELTTSNLLKASLKILSGF